MIIWRDHQNQIGSDQGWSSKCLWSSWCFFYCLQTGLKRQLPDAALCPRQEIAQRWIILDFSTLHHKDRTKVDTCSQKLFGKKIVNIVPFKMATSSWWSDSIYDDIYRGDHQSLVIQLFSITNCSDGLLAMIIKETKLWQWSSQPPLVSSTVVMIAMIIVSLSSTMSSHQITKWFFFFQNCDNDHLSHLW